MKKNYETPNVEVVKFQYKDQIVAQSGGCWTLTHYPAPGANCSNYETIYKK